MTESTRRSGMGRRATYGPRFRVARARAFERSKGLCQLCGRAAATDGHHWAVHYPSDADLGADDITALCRVCHATATAYRRYLGFGGSVFAWLRIIQEVVSHASYNHHPGG